MRSNLGEIAKGCCGVIHMQVFSAFGFTYARSAVAEAERLGLPTRAGIHKPAGRRLLAPFQKNAGSYYRSGLGSFPDA